MGSYSSHGEGSRGLLGRSRNPLCGSNCQEGGSRGLQDVTLFL